MKKILAGCAAMVALALVVTSCSTPGGSTGKTVELFNGKDLKGWSYVSADPQVSMEKVWTVADGVITCQGSPVGAIYKGPPVTNFRLRVDYRWAPGGEPGNSGIFSRITPPLKPIPPCVEVQLKPGSAGDLMGLQGRKVQSAKDRFFTVKAHPVAGDIAGFKKFLEAENPAGQWNTVEILARDTTYKVWMNDQLVNEATGLEQVAGPVGLQSEGGVVQFRNIRLTNMD